MDVFLTDDAERSFKALSLLSGSGQCGYLIGHRRGPRVYVEAIIPAGKGHAFSVEEFHLLDTIYDGRTVGFFFFGGERSAEKRILQPFAYGKIVLEVRPGGRPAPALKAFSVEYKSRFTLSPVPLASSPEGRKA
ncbi:hypothetical protein D4R89_02230 [bacterium]|nr:MAG: hypothetical protein D4R89_02230 [bacterium]